MKKVLFIFFKGRIVRLLQRVEDDPLLIVAHMQNN